MQAKINWRTLSSLDWFGIISGSIGLIVDIIALSSILILSSTEASNISIGIWLLAAFTIIYTTIIVGFYSRRFFCIRHRDRSKILTSRQYDRIENGSLSAIIVVGGPLIIAYLINIMILVDKTMPKEKQSLGGSVIVGIFIVALIGTGLCFGIYALSKEIYQAFDPDYKRN